MENFKYWLNYDILGNPIGDILGFLGIFIAGFLLKKILSLTVSQAVYRFIKTEVRAISVSEFVRLTRRPFELLITLLVVYVAFDRLTVPPDWHWRPVSAFGFLMVVERIFLILLSFSIAWLGVQFIKFVALVLRKKADETDTPVDNQLVPFFKDSIIVFWSLTSFLLMLYKVFDINIWALLTSLGIGGLVVALAARETIENLIASVSIMLERPFVVGDSIVLGTLAGDIEQVGFRSSRIRAEDGSLITIPNRLLTSQALENTTQRSYRRAKFHIRLPFGTPPDTVSKIMTDLRIFLQNHALCQDKESIVHLDTLGELGLEILVIYHIKTKSWQTFMTEREVIYFKILEIVNSSGTNFVVGAAKPA
jgi:MscS family membrane protein